MSQFSLPRCPHCSRPLGDGPCPCQERIPWNSVPTWWPNSRSAWLLVGAMVPGMLGLCLWAWLFDHLSYVRRIMPVGFFALPLFVQFVPTGRRRGGCCLGCWMVAAAWLGMLAGMALLSSHRPPWKREVPALARLDMRQAVTCAGLGLDLSRAEIESRLGPGTPAPAPPAYMRRRYPGDLDVIYSNEGPVRISGPTLEQNGKVLVRVGDPRKRRDQLFYNGAEGTVFPIQGGENMQIVVACPGDRVERLVLLKGLEQPRSVRYPP